MDIVKLEIFIPQTHLMQLRAALQAVDAGHIGNYDSAMSYSAVCGCWRPLSGAKPYLGEEGALCEAAEYKVEVCCKMEHLRATIAAIKAAHPYEEPVINAIPLLATGL